MSSDSLPSVEDALLSRLPRFLANAWHRIGTDKAWFGDGSAGENGIRSNASAAFALATWIRNQPAPAAAALADQRDQVAAVLRYLCDAHRTGTGACAWGGRWGLDWQSSWWAAKLGLAALQMADLLEPALREQAARVLAAEADRHLWRHAPTGLFLDTKAEETAWDCEALAVAIALAPGHPDAARWRDKLVEFSFNVFSAPQDRSSEATVDGQRVRDAVYTCNVHGDFTLENHGSYHFCYVASPLLSKAYCHFALRLAGVAIPDALQHHVDDIWTLARQTFLTHRFAYPGGQDWARYTYGEYFIVPALSYLQATLADPEIRRIQQARLAVLRDEAAGNADGSFYGTRFTAGDYGGQSGKYETDTFACVALMAALERLPARADDGRARTPIRPVEADFAHVSPESQLCFWRTPHAFFSFCWTYLGSDVPSIVFGPRDRDDLLDWRAGNGIGRVQVLNEGATIGVRTMRRVGDRIEILGQTGVRSRRGRPLYDTHLRVEFDRGEHAVRIRHEVRASSRLWLARVAGLTFRVPNDLFNGLRRELAHGGGTTTLVSRRTPGAVRRKSLWHRALDKLGLRDECLQLGTGPVELDGRLVIESNQPGIVLRRYAYPASTWKSLWVEEFQSPGSTWRVGVNRGDTLLSTDITIRLRVPRD